MGRQTVIRMGIAIMLVEVSVGLLIGDRPFGGWRYRENLWCSSINAGFASSGPRDVCYDAMDGPGPLGLGQDIGDSLP
ncbi:hypothetical protein L1987_09371 [Smallanthus sonchifolius]|uniref:Uncharacterized protein n=1 Tax=Smallanthus sonchifolius TaxID=185202 RepID=A0ACB9JMR3_9ASTR|nr:hypothetical protein L1987_09371 [Smallanthus sonchifolius]